VFVCVVASVRRPTVGKSEKRVARMISSLAAFWDRSVWVTLPTLATLLHSPLPYLPSPPLSFWPLRVVALVSRPGTFHHGLLVGFDYIK